MSSLFYPTLTKQMIQDAGIVTSKYDYSFKLRGFYEPLHANEKSKIELIQPNGDWQIERDGLRIKRSVVIESLPLLLGPNGIAPKNAVLGMYIIWSNPQLTQMGVIRPCEILQNHTQFEFCHDFHPGEISGNLELSLNLYIDKPAELVSEDEKTLMNEAGVLIGQIDYTVLNLSNEFIDFPTREVSDPERPLWWLDLKDWDDPTQTPFDKNHVLLYINNSHKAYKLLSDEKKSIDLLIEIMSTSYLLIISKIIDCGMLQQTIDDVDLAPGSISKFIRKFYLDCDDKFTANQAPEDLQKVIHHNIDRLLRIREESE